MGPPRICTIGDNGRRLAVIIKGDRYPREISWAVTDPEGRTIANMNNRTAKRNAVKEWSTCALPGDHEFKIEDTWGDGICCSYGQGFYKLWVDDKLVHSGNGRYGHGETVPFTVDPIGSGPTVPPTQ